MKNYPSCHWHLSGLAQRFYLVVLLSFTFTISHAKTWHQAIDLGSFTNGEKDVLSAFDAVGNATIIWHEPVYNSTTLAYSADSVWLRSRDKGGAWSAKQKLFSANNYIGLFSLNYGQDGVLRATLGGNGMWLAERYPGQPWSKPKPIMPNRAQGLDIFKINKSGEAINVWPSDVKQVSSECAWYTKLNYQRRNAAGVLSAPKVLTTEPSGVGLDSVEISEAGEAFVHWRGLADWGYLPRLGCIPASITKNQISRRTRTATNWQTTNSPSFFPVGIWRTFGADKLAGFGSQESGPLGPLYFSLTVQDAQGIWSQPTSIFSYKGVSYRYYALHDIETDESGNVTIIRSFPTGPTPNRLETITGNLNTNTWNMPSTIAAKPDENLTGKFDLSPNNYAITAGLWHVNTIDPVTNAITVTWTIHAATRTNNSLFWTLPAKVASTAEQRHYLELLGVKAAPNGDAMVIFEEQVTNPLTYQATRNLKISHYY